jgi:hypothetical protein
MAVASKIGARHYLECSAKTGEGIREVFQYATRAALLVPRQPDRPTKGFKAIRHLFKSAPKSLYPSAMSSADAKAELEKFLASSAAPDSFKFFRLLIIGKTGCGKTTILGKVIFIICACRKAAQFVTGMRRKYGKRLLMC